MEDRRKYSIDPDLIWVELKALEKKVDSLSTKVYIMFGAFSVISVVLEILSRNR